MVVRVDMKILCHDDMCLRKQQTGTVLCFIHAEETAKANETCAEILYEATTSI